MLRESLDKTISSPNLLMAHNSAEVVGKFNQEMFLPIDFVYDKFVQPMQTGLSRNKFFRLLPLIDSVQIQCNHMRHISFCAYTLSIFGLGSTTFPVMQKVINSDYPHYSEVQGMADFQKHPADKDVGCRMTIALTSYEAVQRLRVWLDSEKERRPLLRYEVHSISMPPDQMKKNLVEMLNVVFYPKTPQGEPKFNIKAPQFTPKTPKPA